MKRSADFLALWIGYTALIVGVFIWSGKNSVKTVYDRYPVSLVGLTLPVAETDYPTVLTFYRDVLSLEQVDALPFGPPVAPAAFRLPDGKLLLLQSDGAHEQHRARLVIRTRTGIEKLHNALSEAQRAHQLGRISPIQEGPQGDYFIAHDPSGHEIAFITHRSKLIRRLPKS
ncbi:MAG: VOC family protein [Bdellovibrionales bacterium]|nr:VOC family protein [Bdellovibrionales bacterium]